MKIGHWKHKDTGESLLWFGLTYSDHLPVAYELPEQMIAVFEKANFGINDPKWIKNLFLFWKREAVWADGGSQKTQIFDYDLKSRQIIAFIFGNVTFMDFPKYHEEIVYHLQMYLDKAKGHDEAYRRTQQIIQWHDQGKIEFENL